MATTKTTRPASVSVSNMSVRPSLHPLKTPASATLPSELPSRSPYPYPGTPASARIKDEDGGFMKTPITPPTAYMDFLKAVSSPSGGIAMAGGLKSAPTSAPWTSKSTSSSSCERSNSSSSVDTLKSRSSSSSSSSHSSTCSCPCVEHGVGVGVGVIRPATSKISPTTTASMTLPSPPSTTTTTTTTAIAAGWTQSQSQPPQSAPLSSGGGFPKQPQSAPLRRLRIPASASSPLLLSPATTTATTIDGASPISAAFSSIRSPFTTIRSPLDLDLEKKWSLNNNTNNITTNTTDGTNSNGTTTTRKPVSVRQVVTRTVTYTPRMDLAPAPKGKKRRLD
ncbi:MAG: hypothetical protein M1823_002779 [Watsoniomyces obsoletus]|nr:MAG: hypothetical protein M1823_002779 [Watsoniomyces obsoletus]